jgi:hypothetical protein
VGPVEAACTQRRSPVSVCGLGPGLVDVAGAVVQPPADVRGPVGHEAGAWRRGIVHSRSRQPLLIGCGCAARRRPENKTPARRSYGPRNIRRKPASVCSMAANRAGVHGPCSNILRGTGAASATGLATVSDCAPASSAANSRKRKHFHVAAGISGAALASGLNDAAPKSSMRAPCTRMLWPYRSLRQQPWLRRCSRGAGDVVATPTTAVGEGQPSAQDVAQLASQGPVRVVGCGQRGPRSMPCCASVGYQSAQCADQVRV